MPPLPSVSGMRVVRALERHGFKVARVSGSHHIMRHPDGRGTTVPVAGRRRGTTGRKLTGDVRVVTDSEGCCHETPSSTAKVGRSSRL
jgi:predicted RNA binding protein YcfA (HicA-like mRNA interferase family)